MPNRKVWFGRGVWPVIEIVILILVSAAPDCRPFDFVPAWIEAVGGSRPPRSRQVFKGGAGKDGYFRIALSGSHPYSLPDLWRGRVEFLLRNPRRSVSGWWDALDHPLYREDRWGCGFSVILPADFLGIGFESMGGRRCVAGCDPRWSLSATGAASLRLPGQAWCELDLPLLKTESALRAPLLLRVVISNSRASLIFNRKLGPSPEKGDTRVGAVVPLSDYIQLLSGYHLATDEISGGIYCAGKAALFSFSWSVHPVLGESFAVAVGRLW